MYKSLLIFICLTIPAIASISSADPWKAYGGNYSEIMGNPIVIRDVQVTKEVIVDGKAYYMYKLIISRPSNDNGTGVAPWGIADTRLYYWAAVHGPNRIFSIFDDRETPQFKYEGRPDLIIVYIPQGLAPSRIEYNIRVGALPYPMAFGHDFRRAIQLYRSDYKLYLDLVASYTGLYGLATKYMTEKVKDTAIDGTLSRWVSVYGQELKIEAYAKIPDIVGMTIARANKELRMRTLIPRLNQKVYNPDGRLHGRVKEIVGRYDIIDRNRIRANTQVSYNVWTSTFSGDQNPQPQPHHNIYSDNYKNFISADEFLDNESKTSFVAFYYVPCSSCAAEFRIKTENDFIDFKRKTSKPITVLGRGKTEKEAARQACGKLKKVKPRLGLSYKHNGWLIRGVGSRCN